MTHGGILIMVAGYFLVNVLGLTDGCSTELTAKAVEYAPLVIGGVTAWIGRVRAGGVTLGGFKKVV